MPETTPLIKAALNLRVGAGFDVYVGFLLFAKRNGGSVFSKPPEDSIGALIDLLYDGFFSFAVVRQIIFL